MFIKNDREIMNKSAVFRLKLSFPNVSGLVLHQWNYQFVETAANERTNERTGNSTDEGPGPKRLERITST